jgi:hypothetical protein
MDMPFASDFVPIKKPLPVEGRPKRSVQRLLGFVEILLKAFQKP